MSLINDLAGIVEKVSPVVGSMLGSPLGGILTTLLANTLKANPTDLKDIIEKLKADPEADLKIKELESLASDLSSARDREVAYTNATKQRDWMLPLLSVMVAFGFFMLILIAMFSDLDHEEKYFMYGMILGIGVQFAQVYNYYFGRYNSELITSISTPFIKFYNTLFKKP